MASKEALAEGPLELPRYGSVLAAAGCGKTEQIALAVKRESTGRRLILTHTHAGIHSLKKRLKTRDVSADTYRLDTLAGWCLWYVSSYPRISGFLAKDLSSDTYWTDVYQAAGRLINSRALDRVILASYTGVLVDEYQDCDADQHAVVKALARMLPVSVFGDYMQAIFQFNKRPLVSWSEVQKDFPNTGTLNIPWRWHKEKNHDLADWLKELRSEFEAGMPVDLTNRPPCVEWLPLPSDGSQRAMAILGTCKKLMNRQGSLIVIGDPINPSSRAAIAKGLAKAKFSNIEPIDCSDLNKFARKFDSTQPQNRFDAIMKLVGSSMVGSDTTAFCKAIVSKRNGLKAGVKKFGSLIDVGVLVQETGNVKASLDLLCGFSERDHCHIYRHELLSSAKLALRFFLTGAHSTLAEAVKKVQSRVRHTGRYIHHRSVGSTLLVKGLEFDHSVIIYSERMGLEDWYVALTRASQTVTVLSPHIRFAPSAGEI